MNTIHSLGVPQYEFRVILGSTKIDYDPNKETINRKKHGYSLESAVHILERLLLIGSIPVPHIITDSFIENGEVRQVHLTLDDGGNVVLIVTTMRPEETVRVISFRRADEDENNLFRNQVLCPVSPP